MRTSRNSTATFHTSNQTMRACVCAAYCEDCPMLIWAGLLRPHFIHIPHQVPRKNVVAKAACLCFQRRQVVGSQPV